MCVCCIDLFDFVEVITILKKMQYLHRARFVLDCNILFFLINILHLMVGSRFCKTHLEHVYVKRTLAC